MKDQIILHFSFCIEKGWLVRENSSFFQIYEIEGISVICKDHFPNSLSFVDVRNPKEKDLHFLSIDKAIINDNLSKKCDFAIFDESTICFAEIKTASSSKRGERRRDAYEQLKTTILHFQSIISFDNYQIEAWICFGTKNRYPKTTSKNMVMKKAMFDECRAILCEGNEMMFE